MTEFWGRTIVEELPKKINGSSCIVERGAQAIEAHILSFFSYLRHKVGRTTAPREKFVALLLECAASILNRLPRARMGTYFANDVGETPQRWSELSLDRR